jgi:membrane associated rhomboid family serine protease
MIPIRDRLSTRTTPVVTYAILALNVLVFLAELAAAQSGYAEVTSDWGFVPARFMADPSNDLVTIATSMFMHGGWLHLLGNMLFLWIFGDNVEDALGHVRFGLFYLVGGVAAVAAQLAVDPSTSTPMIGASGAISAVLAGYLSLYPRARVLVLVPIFIVITFFEFPAWLVILEWFALQLLSGFSNLALGAQGAGVAWFAHIGGFIAGLVLIRVFMVGRVRLPYERWRTWRVGRDDRSVRRRGGYASW